MNFIARKYTKLIRECWKKIRRNAINETGNSIESNRLFRYMLWTSALFVATNSTVEIYLPTLEGHKVTLPNTLDMVNKRIADTLKIHKLFVSSSIELYNLFQPYPRRAPLNTDHDPPFIGCLSKTEAWGCTKEIF